MTLDRANQLTGWGGGRRETASDVPRLYWLCTAR